MTFNPLAFLKPKKAFSMEGLLSRDMFEKFASSDEGAGRRVCSNTENRFQSLSRYAIQKTNEIAGWLNTWECVEITMGQAVLIINGNSGSDWDNLYVRHLDDQILTRDEIIGTMDLIREKLLSRINGITKRAVKPLPLGMGI